VKPSLCKHEVKDVAPRRGAEREGERERGQGMGLSPRVRKPGVTNLAPLQGAERGGGRPPF